MPNIKVKYDNGVELYKTDFSKLPTMLDALNIKNKAVVKLAILERNPDNGDIFEHASPMLVLKNGNKYDVVNLMPDAKMKNLLSSEKLNVIKPIAELDGKPISPIHTSGCLEATFFTLNKLSSIITPNGIIALQDAGKLKNNSKFTTANLLKLSCSNRYINAMDLPENTKEELRNFRKSFEYIPVSKDYKKLFTKTDEERIKQEKPVNILLNSLRSLRQNLIQYKSSEKCLNNYEIELKTTLENTQNRFNNTPEGEKKLNALIDLKNAQNLSTAFQNGKNELKDFIDKNISQSAFKRKFIANFGLKNNAESFVAKHLTKKNKVNSIIAK